MHADHNLMRAVSAIQILALQLLSPGDQRFPRISVQQPGLPICTREVNFR